MGSATRGALDKGRAALASTSGATALTIGEQLFTASRVISGSRQLRSILVDPSTEDADKATIIRNLFGTQDERVQDLLVSLAQERWSSPDDFVTGIEELAIRATALSAGKDLSIERELFTFAAAVSSDSDLELAVGSKLGDPAGKLALVQRLLEGKASPQTLAILGHLVQRPGERRIGEHIRYAARIVADEAQLSVATVTSAAPLDDAQLDKLAAALGRSNGRGVSINQVVDPSVLGGIRVQIGDEVIDGTVATRLDQLKLQLVG